MWQKKPDTVDSALVMINSRQQIWTLTQTGNWDINRVDRDGDNDFIDATNGGEWDESRTHNEPNELLDRDLDTDGDTQYDDTNYSLAYNLRGDMTDDGNDYTMVYDVFGRVCTIKNRGNAAVVQENKYNGLGHRKSFKIDTDLDGDVDGSLGGADLQYPHPPQ